jgi:hypothetical protein
VAAVLAMQGNLSMATAQLFLPAFFVELNRSGAVDAATAAGRRAAADANRPDAWVPILFTRLVEGRVWYQAGTSRADEFDYDQLWDDIRRGRCVPILGSGVLEPFLGDTRDLAHRLAAAHRYPLALSSRDDLPQVAQYLKINKGDRGTRNQLMAAMAAAIARGYLAEGQVLDNRLSVLNQVQGGALQAVSWTLLEQVRYNESVVTSVDWERYPILRFSDAFKLEVEVVDRPDQPTLGVGECAHGPVAAALGNALFDALGVRVRDLPLDRDTIARAIHESPN